MHFRVYILASPSRVLYVGVTRDLPRRMAQHLNAGSKTFVGRYKVHQLVHVEAWPTALSAITREKQIKRWRRSKKLALIASSNPEWRDLSPDADR